MTLVFTGTLTLDLLLGDVHSLKEKRGLIRPVLAELNRRPAVGAAEVGAQDLHRRAILGVAVVAGSHQRVVDLLDDCEGAVAWRPEFELLSARRRVRSDEDD
ncbi:MAG TPA: DUF503 domain-containing protein [Actinocrinis sp.]|jgi:uncharacterized protein|nr:DUF503 domain-containing protein [Actinocrinis sp.]HXR73970.1 DUF503 domain-containing protein [Actinocrinis sp.]